MNGNYLVLGQVSPEDTGLYTCQVSAYKPTQLTHSLSVRGEEYNSVTVTLSGEEVNRTDYLAKRQTCNLNRKHCKYYSV